MSVLQFPGEDNGALLGKIAQVLWGWSVHPNVLSDALFSFPRLDRPLQGCCHTEHDRGEEEYQEWSKTTYASMVGVERSTVISKATCWTTDTSLQMSSRVKRSDLRRLRLPSEFYESQRLHWLLPHSRMNDGVIDTLLT
jgi:hypothetical protein